MSTNYYLINKKDAEIKQSLVELIDIQLQKFKDNLLAFGEENKLSDFHEAIDSMIDTISNDLNDGLFEPLEIHICKTRKNALTWQITDYWKDEKSFIKFYMDNIDEYYIENEYKEEFFILDFVSKIFSLVDTTEYLHEDFV